MANLCVIPARGGSKRIPRKNIKDFLGKPIIAYSIQAALDSGLFDEVMVSTDDAEIAAIAQQYGAKIPFIRTATTSNDFATLSDVINEVRKHYAQAGIAFQNICCILATAPFVTKKLLQDSFEFFCSKKFNTLRPVVKFSYPPQRGFKLVDDYVSFVYPEYSKTRSQDLEDIFFDAGMFYWLKFDKGLSQENRGGFIIDQQYAQDIDTLDDWSLAELKYKILFGLPQSL